MARSQSSYPHPDLAEILDETYGVIVYQDQVLHIAQKFAGYTLGQADIMRKAMGKKIREKMVAERQRFTRRREARRATQRRTRGKIFDLIEPFAGYAFNKAHAACYGTIAYQTAYLKANYPVEYMTAVLDPRRRPNASPTPQPSAPASGWHVLPPDVNRSQPNFGLEAADGEVAIRFGLADDQERRRGRRGVDHRRAPESRRPFAVDRGLLQAGRRAEQARDGESRESRVIRHAGRPRHVSRERRPHSRDGCPRRETSSQRPG